MNVLRSGLVCLAVAGTAATQQLQWQVPASSPETTEYYWIGPYIDFDGDGFRDYMRVVKIGATLPLQVVSGSDGATLWSHMHPFGYIEARAQHAGDVDDDGNPDLAIIRGGAFGLRHLDLWSPSLDASLWTIVGTHSTDFGDSLLADIDLDGDRQPDVLVTTSSSTQADVQAYDGSGNLLYVVPCLAKHRIPISLAKMGDLDGDRCDDFLIGCLDTTDRGVQWLISGRTGNPIRETYGLLPGDRTAEHVTNLGDIDGDGVDDYAAWPYFSALRLVAVAYSGATGAVIRSWPDYTESVVAGEDFDQDGVNDYVVGADWVVGPGASGRTTCFSWRDGSVIWRVDNWPLTPNTIGNNGALWFYHSASLGTQPGSPYPVLAWMNASQSLVGTFPGLTRAYGGARAGQGPVTGQACTSNGALPLIGARAIGSGATATSRITVARTHPNALAALNLAFTALPTPVDLSPLGFGDCSVYVDGTATWLRVTGAAGLDRGHAAVDLPHPLSASTVGTDAVAQWLVYDPLTLDYAATQMHAVRLE